MKGGHASFLRMSNQLFSIRMRATQSSIHISGAERICSASGLSTLAADMVERALNHSRGAAEAIQISIDALSVETVRTAPLPDITTVIVKNFVEGRKAARAELIKAGVSAVAADAAICALVHGAAPGAKVMRGAMLVDSLSGERLENDLSRGLRVSRMDLTPETGATLTTLLMGSGRDTLHLREALVLAGKVLLSPGIVAELCWSDDPGYTAGYVASPARGYVRFPHLKESGDHLGGRAFFYQRSTFDLQGVTDFLERTPVLFTSVGRNHCDEVFSE